METVSRVSFCTSDWRGLVFDPLSSPKTRSLFPHLLEALTFSTLDSTQFCSVHEMTITDIC